MGEDTVGEAIGEAGRNGDPGTARGGGDAAGGPLAGLLVLDLTRVLAGPSCTQLLGDLGADVVKIERPGRGDDTRAWGPPFVQDADGRDTPESAYYLSANRNKRSVAVDIASPEGQALIRRIAAKADFLFENFKVGALARYGLDYASVCAINPRIIYGSVTGFGQTGPLASLAGYDFMIQGRGGIMSVTGFPDDEGGRPTKVGVGIADVMTGMYMASAALAALHHRHITGRGQAIDVALFDSQLAWLVNQGAAFLMDGKVPGRIGNSHPTIVPYETFEASDGHFIIAVGNDGQFRALVTVLGRPDLADDPRYARNRDRVANRRALVPLLNGLTRSDTRARWIAALEAVGVPVGPIHDFAEAFSDPQAIHRGARVTQPHPTSATGTVDTIGNPIKLGATPVTYRRAPPTLGQHTDEVLSELLGIDADERSRLRSAGVIG